jgi:SPP1 family predicted phage head-tail adaptor
MEIGKLNKRVTFQRRSATLDDYGQQLDAWTEVATVWANVEPVGGREKMMAMAINAQLTHRVSVRYTADLMPPIDVTALRIHYNTPTGVRIFNILSAKDSHEARKHIIFDCVEGSLDGQ